jgi:hypothetical protein
MEWREIKDFDNYMISSCGIVKSVQRVVKVSNKKTHINKTINERFLKPSLSGSGYGFVCLRKDNKHHNKRIHVMVAESFISDRPKGLVINHIDGNKLNNNVINLEYVSKQRNTQHYYQSIGKSIGKVLISEIPNILYRVSNGEEIFKIAKQYNVSRNDIAVLCKIILLTGEELTLKQSV